MELKTAIEILEYHQEWCIIKNDEYYLWKIQKWLREVHNIHICVDINIEDNWYFNIYNLNSKRNSEFDLKLENNKFKSYEETLKVGLQEALKLIK